MHYQFTGKQVRELKDAGIPSEHLDGFSILPIDEYCLNEYYNIRREQGYDVPEDHVPQEIPEIERAHRWQEKCMFDSETKRTSEEPLFFPDPYSTHYDEDDLEIDEVLKDQVPEHIYNKRRIIERKEVNDLLWGKRKAARANTRRISSKLVEMRTVKLLKIQLEAILRLQKAKKELGEKCK
jgi:hypothetical protein